MRTCLFCEARANSKEDVWSRWILASIGEDRGAPTEYWNNVSLPPKTWPGPKFTTKHVCSGCNNGWMSRLESGVRTSMGGLIHDLSFQLDVEQQRAVALWASKTAMVFDGVKQEKNRFYSLQNRHRLRKELIPPPDTVIWIGRCAQSNLLHAEAKKLNPRKSGRPNPLEDGCATTFVIGRLVIQLLSVKRTAGAERGNLKVQMQEGPWDRKLAQIWPVEKERVSWPPPESFSDLDDRLRDLRRRFTVGISSDTAITNPEPNP